MPLWRCQPWHGGSGAAVLTRFLAEVIAQRRHLGPVDDAQSSLRYADNWAAGRRLVFNPGEHVEGYTNYLLVLRLG